MTQPATSSPAQPASAPSLRKRAHRAYHLALTHAAEQGGQAAVDLALAELGRKDLFFLLVYLLRRRDIDHDWLFARCREVQAHPDGYLDLWAREHYKSTIITFGLTIQDILNDPEVTFGIFSHTRPIAKGFLIQIKREFEGNDLLKRVYSDVLWENPRKEAPKWSEDDGLVVKRKTNPKESTVEAWGLVDGQPTSKHFRKRIYDDVVTKESVTTSDQIKKTTESWELSQALGAEGGPARHAGTRYSMGDTYGVMMTRGVVKPRLYPVTVNGKVDGEPTFRSRAWIANKRAEMGSQFAAQMLLNPAGGIERTFDLQWLKSWEVRPRLLNVYILGDPSKGRTARSDRTALAVIGIDSAENKYLLDGMRHRMNLAQRWDALKTMHRRWTDTPGVQTVSVGYEEYGLQADLEYFEERMRLERYAFGITTVAWPREGGHSKEDRVGRLVPDIMKGRFRLPAVMWEAALGMCLWSVPGPLSDGAKATMTPETIAAHEREIGKLKLRAMQGDTAAMRTAKANGAEDTVAASIRRVDEEKRVYDLTAALIEELTYFPFGLHDDLVDACSRIYDMDPVAPAVVHQQDIEPTEYVDGV